jgi:hypothetical protein
VIPFRGIAVAEQTTNKPNRALRVLLLVCAGALIVIFVTLMSVVDNARDSQVNHLSIQMYDACGVPLQKRAALPNSVQLTLNAQCNNSPATTQQNVEIVP